MLSIQAKIPKFRSKAGTLQPVLPLIPEKSSTTEEEKSVFITFELMTRVGKPTTGTKYKKNVRKFEDGSPQQWIDILRDLEEIWVQNSINGGTNCVSTVRALVKGESLTAFDTALEDARTDEEGNQIAIVADHVQKALDAIMNMVFPHRALEIQKTWMNRKMFKPKEYTTRQTSAAIT